MQLLVNGPEHTAKIREFLKKYRELRFAVAWASSKFELGYGLISHKERIKRAIVGTHFFQTDPEFMEAWKHEPFMRFDYRTYGVFHPKVYLFENGPEEWEAIIGSANFTRGAFGCGAKPKNQEISIVIRSGSPGAEEVYERLRSQIDIYWTATKETTDEDVAKYRRNAAKRKSSIDALTEDDPDGERGNDSRKTPKAHQSHRINLATDDIRRVMDLDFEGYADLVRRTDTAFFSQRIFILKEFRNYFSSSNSFGSMPSLHRKRIAGVHDDEGVGTDHEIRWKLFGAMTVMGWYRDGVDELSTKIAQALDHIPLDGLVTKNEYKEFLGRFLREIPKGLKIGAITRLLTAKRPDQFVSVNSASQRKLAILFGCDETRITKLEHYWDEIIEPMRATKWWSSSSPAGPNQDIWLNRAALLDSICYEYD